MATENLRNVSCRLRGAHRIARPITCNLRIGSIVRRTGSPTVYGTTSQNLSLPFHSRPPALPFDSVSARDVHHASPAIRFPINLGWFRNDVVSALLKPRQVFLGQKHV